MTPRQVLIVSALGGLFVVIALIVVVAVAIGLYMAVSRVLDARRALTEWRRRRQRLQDLETCWVLESLDTVNHPKE